MTQSIDSKNQKTNMMFSLPFAPPTMTSYKRQISELDKEIQVTADKVAKVGMEFSEEEK